MIKNKNGAKMLTAAILLASGLFLAACGEEPTTTGAATTSTAVSTPEIVGSPAVSITTSATGQARQITFPPLILAEPLPGSPTTVAGPTSPPSQNSQPTPATTLPVLPGTPAIDGAAARPTTPANPPTSVTDSRAGGELVGKVLQKNNAGQNFQLTVKRVERLSRVRDSAGKYYTPASPNGIFLLVLYDVRNNAAQPMAYAEFALRDNQGQVYKTGANPQLEAAQKTYKLFWDTPEVAVGKLSQQYRVFEVPKNAAGFQLSI